MIPRIAILLAALLLVPTWGPAAGPSPDERHEDLQDGDYAAGVAAWERQDWAAMIPPLTRVIRREPWHDDAHSLLGFAHRKLGDYEQALAHYHRALALNPHHRQAMEYLGEAYVELGRLDQARELLERLAVACERVLGANWRGECEEWADLGEALEGAP